MLPLNSENFPLVNVASRVRSIQLKYAVAAILAGIVGFRVALNPTYRG